MFVKKIKAGGELDLILAWIRRPGQGRVYNPKLPGTRVLSGATCARS